MRENPFIEKALANPSRTALRVGDSEFTYGDIAKRATMLGGELSEKAGSMAGMPVACLIEPGLDYVAAQWAVWSLGGIFLPLSLAATEKEIAYALEDSGAAGAFVSKSLEPRIKEVSGAEKLAIVVTETCLIEKPLQQVDHDPASGAMILYTSGTTAKPKGVLTTHANIQAQIEALVKAWEWSADDRIPLFLPLHHVHGIINVLGSALWSGAMVDVMSRFDASLVCSRLCRGDYTVFMAVPTIYSLLVTHLEKASESDRAASCRAFGQLRLMVSGSAALPTPVFEKWRNLTGQSLLERYGMTEIGMALSNPLHGERRPGTVGLPLPGVEVRLVSESGIVHQPGESGEIQIRGENVFKEYWRKPEATAETFTNDWFRTGDVAVLEDGYYKILGRLSVDIIKSAGYKLSALEIESSLLEHPDIRECAVVGVPDETWGEVVAAALVVSENKPSSEAIEQWCQSKMSRYKIPRLWLISENLPRNAMGKVLKPAVKDLFKQ